MEASFRASFGALSIDVVVVDDSVSFVVVTPCWPSLLVAVIVRGGGGDVGGGEEGASESDGEEDDNGSNIISPLLFLSASSSSSFLSSELLFSSEVAAALSRGRTALDVGEDNELLLSNPFVSLPKGPQMIPKSSSDVNDGCLVRLRSWATAADPVEVLRWSFTADNIAVVFCTWLLLSFSSLLRFLYRSIWLIWH